MSIKVAEVEFAPLIARHHIWGKKMMHNPICPKCHTPFLVSTAGNDDNTESIVDYYCFIGNQPLWVECKGRHVPRWPFSELTEKQARFLQSWYDRDVMSTVFLLVGDGKAPDGRSAFWIPWIRLKEFMGHYRMRSVNLDDANELLERYRLSWNRGWEITPDTWIAKYYPNVLTLPPLK